MSEARDFASRIAQQTLFRDLPPRFLQDLVQVASEEHWSADQFIFHEGEPAQRFYLIQSGTVALEVYAAQRGVVRLQTLHGGDLLGWSWLFPPFTWHFDAHVLEAGQALSFDALPFLALCEADHELGYQIMRRFSQLVITRLQATRLQLLDLYGGGQT